MKRILVVDDEEAVREVLGEGLKAYHYDVQAAASAEEAQRLLSEGDWDLVVLDLALADADGLDLLTEIRRVRPKIPVVLMTGMELDDALRAEARRRGATACLNKLRTLDELAAQIRMAVGEPASP